MPERVRHLLAGAGVCGVHRAGVRGAVAGWESERMVVKGEGMSAYRCIVCQKVMGKTKLIKGGQDYYVCTHEGCLLEGACFTNEQAWALNKKLEELVGARESMNAAWNVLNGWIDETIVMQRQRNEARRWARKMKAERDFWITHKCW